MELHEAVTKKSFTIKVSYVNPPIPTREQDYCALFDEIGEEDSPYGYGPTGFDAVADLMSLAEEIIAEEREANGQYGVGA